MPISPTRPVRRAGLRAGLLVVLLAAVAPAAPAQASLSARPVAAAGADAPAASPFAPLLRSSAPAPLTPQQIHSVYALPRTGAHGQTIAVLSLYDDPHVQADLNHYDQHFHLPACTGAHGCFRKLNEAGRPRPLPVTDPSGGQFTIEAALGVQTAHQICQSCRVLLIETSTASGEDLAAAATTAARLGATVSVTSAILSEYQVYPGIDAAFSHPRTVLVAATGDPTSGTYGYTGQVNFPSSLPSVLGVGGTRLTRAPHGGYRQQAWPGTVSGCSMIYRAPAWQAADAVRADCATMRAVADLSADADPGILAYITGAGIPGGPWYAVTGTSVAAPIIAGVIGLAGSAGSGEAAMLYRHAGELRDIRTGFNAPGCHGVICHAGPGYDGPTGLGTPFGLAAFLRSGGTLSSRHPGLTVALPTRTPNVSRSRVRLTVKNQNPFAVSGTIVLRASVAAGRRRTVVRFDSPVAFRLGPLGSTAVSITVSRSERARLRWLGRVLVYAQARARGAAGPSVAFLTRAGTLSAR